MAPRFDLPRRFRRAGAISLRSAGFARGAIVAPARVRGIDRLAARVGARLVVHGHHHESYAATLAGGIQVRGLAVAETLVLATA